MRGGGVLVGVSIVAGLASVVLGAPKDGIATAPKGPPASVASAGGAGGASAAPAGGTWSILVRPNQRWVLKDPEAEAPYRVIVVETYDAHVVAGAAVARLRWTVKDAEHGKTAWETGSDDGPCFKRLAVNERGLYFLKDGMDDAAIAKVVQGKPSRSDPPKPYEGTKKNHGRYLSVREYKDGQVICLGDGPEPGAGECEDTCFAEMCMSPTKGVVQISGTAAPFNAVYEQAGFKLDE